PPPEPLFHSPASAARRPAFPEETLAESPASQAAEERPEEITELTEVLRSPVDGVPAVFPPPGAAEHVLPAAAALAKLEDPIVFGPLVGIVQDLVRFVDLLEARLRLLVAGVHVRVMLAGQSPEGLADCLRIGRSLDPEDLVVVRSEERRVGKGLE